MAATKPGMAVCGLMARHVLAKAAGACESNAATGSLDACGVGDDVLGGGDVLAGAEVAAGPGALAEGDGELVLENRLRMVTRSCCGITEKIRKPDMPRSAMLAPMVPRGNAHRGPRRCSRASRADASTTWASIRGSRRS